MKTGEAERGALAAAAEDSARAAAAAGAALRARERALAAAEAALAHERGLRAHRAAVAQAGAPTGARPVRGLPRIEAAPGRGHGPRARPAGCVRAGLLRASCAPTQAHAGKPCPCAVRI